MEESWKPVVGYEGLYEVSDLGRVRSLDRVVLCRAGATRLIPGKFLKGTPDKHGYLVVRLYLKRVEGVSDGKSFFVHRLVASAFVVGASENLDTVNHLNAVKTDNRALNLEWATRGDNVRHAASLNLLNADRCPGKSRITSSQAASVKELLLSGSSSMREISQKLDVPYSVVRAISAGEVWSTHAEKGLRLTPVGPWWQPGRRVKLTPEDVLEIRSLLGTMPERAIACQFRICVGTVRKIRFGTIWKDAAIT